MTTTSKKPAAISALRQRMIDDMTARKLQPGTQRGHLRGCKRFAIWLGRAPDEASADDVRAFQLHLNAEQVQINGTVSGTIKGMDVTLSSSAVVEGDIYYQTITLQQGALFEGRSRRLSDQSDLKPNLSSVIPAPSASGQASPQTAAPQPSSPQAAAAPQAPSIAEQPVAANPGSAVKAN